MSNESVVRSLSDSLIAQEILNNARAAVGALSVELTEYDHRTGEITQSATSAATRLDALNATPAQSAIQTQLRLLSQSINIHSNPIVDQIYRLARPVHVCVQEAADQIIPLEILTPAIESGMVGMVYGSPLIVGGEVVGAIHFHRRHRFSTKLLTIAEAFVRQATLILENRQLAGRLAAQRILTDQAHHRIIQAQEQVRREVAERLHGHLQTRLLIMEHQLQMIERGLAEDSPARNSLAVIGQDLSQIRQQEVRELSHRLHPSMIALGLIPALQSMAEELAPMTVDIASDPTFELIDQAQDPALEPSIRLNSYRIVEEALQNAHHHGHAGRAMVGLEVRARDTLTISVSDDGQGFDTDSISMGLGLVSIAARVNDLNGQWSLVSEIGRGTVVVVQIPLAYQTPT